MTTTTKIGKEIALPRPLVPILCVCIAALVFASSQRIVGQNHEAAVPDCKVGAHAPALGYWTWAQNSKVRVYILAGHFDDEAISHLLQPLQTWNAIAEATTSRVRFVYEGTTLEPQNCSNCLTIMRGKIFEKRKRHAAELHAFSAQATQVIDNARIVLDPMVSNGRQLMNAMAHELGHSFGLLDCYSCDQRSTVMKFIQHSNGLEAPTSCDIVQIRAAYEELKRQVRPAPVAATIIPDEGEEPVEDDTAIVISPPN